MADTASPFNLVPDGLEVRLRLSPGASRDAIGDVVVDEQRNGVLKIAVTAIPEKGKANAAAIKLLAKSWKLRKTDCQIIRGVTDRNKTLLIHGDGKLLLASLQSQLYG